MRDKTLIALFLIFQCFTATAIAGQDAAKGKITGQMLIKEGVPISKGFVYFYAAESGHPPTGESYGRVPDYIAEMDNNGRFTTDLSGGNYYIEAGKGKEGRPGPPTEGDYHIIIKDKAGLPAQFAVKEGQTTDLGIISGIGLFKKSAGGNGHNISGIVMTDEGAPVENAVVFAYKNPDMRGKPFLVSDKTGKDGKYKLPAQPEVPFFLVAREIYSAGRPKSGDRVGIYGENGPVPVVVHGGEKVTGVNIKVRKLNISE